MTSGWIAPFLVEISCIYFNSRDWGSDRLVLFDLGNFESFLPLAPPPLRPKQAVAQMPISKAARREFLHLLVTYKDQIPEIPSEDKVEYLYTLSYRDFLSKHLKIREPEVFAVLQDLTTDSGVGIERHIRSQLAGMLGSGGFDPARDIEGITVNRWPHGYSYSWYNPLFDPVYEEDDDERYPHIRARKRFGRIAIANADAGANAMFETAVEQGHRAVTELT